MIGNTETKAVRALKAHLAINVRNVDQSIGFYRKLWGIEPSKVRSGYAKFDVQNPPLNFTLNEVAFNATGERGALSHLGIQVSLTADVLATRERWAEAGLITRDEMQTSCCYALQDKTWVRDPDGNEWEVFVVHQDNLPETAPVNAEWNQLSNRPQKIQSPPLAVHPHRLGRCIEPSAAKAAGC